MKRILIIAGVAILVVALILIPTSLVLQSKINKCINNFASNLRLSQADAACLYKQFKKQNVPKDVWNPLCNPLTPDSVLQLFKSLSVDTLGKIQQSYSNCNISYIPPS